ncbi:tetratricopeptide repeat protein [Desulfococcaceae bacterium HSG9]|nr:tetratricopeptide repeat protein [Desulfococcaceae bacterium HSG9]
MNGQGANSHEQNDRRTPADQIAQDISAKYFRVLKADLPFFVIVYYDHEADKLALLQAIKQKLTEKNLSTRPFDPANNSADGVGKLYTLLASASAEPSLSLISGLPIDAQKIRADNDFIHYLNIHRDRIPKERIRMILFLHTSYAEQFIFAAGDLWDFRHGTYWLEREPAESRPGLWAELKRDTAHLDLTAEEKQAIENHLTSVRPLIEETEEPRAKAQLLLDLTKWLHRRYAWLPAAQTAYQGIRHIENERTQLRAALEYELGYALRNKSDLSEALLHYEISLKISREIGDKAGQGTTLNNISQIYDSRGDYDTALKYLKQSLTIKQEIGDKSGEGTTLNNISQIFKARGDYDTALKYLKQDLAITQEMSDKSGQGTTLNNISQIFKARGDYDTALKYLKQSLTIRLEIGDKSGEGTALNNISLIFKARGDYDTALKYLKQSLTIRQETGDKAGEGATLNNISQIFKARGDYDTALKYLKQSLTIIQEIGDKSGEGTTLNNISQIYDARGDYDTALKYIKQSLTIRQEIGDKAGESQSLNNISQIYDARGDYDTALKYLKQSLTIRREIGDKAGEAVTCNNLAREWERRGDIAKAIEYMTQTVAIDEITDHPDLEQDKQYLKRLRRQTQKARLSGLFQTLKKFVRKLF